MGIQKNRDDKLVKELLDKITSAGKNEESVMEPIIDASLNYATLGEIVDSMKDCPPNPGNTDIIKI